MRFLQLAVFLASTLALRAQTPPDDLFKTISSLDTAVFDAYNKCELEKFEAYFADDVEFYHDQSGPMNGKDKLTEALRKNICGKVTRELLPGTVKVYPMKGYGAVQTGSHQFRQGGSAPTGVAQFIHLWQNKNGEWKITRVISFDHQAVKR